VWFLRPSSLRPLKRKSRALRWFQVDAGTLLFAAIFTNNILLTNSWIVPFLAISREIRSALGLGAAVVFVMTCTAVLNYLAYYYVLLPLNLDHFATLCSSLSSPLCPTRGNDR